MVEGLANKWSPEQIAGRLAVDHPDDPDRRVSFESTYRAVYLPEKNNLSDGVRVCLRTRRRLRRSKAHRGGKQQRRGQTKDITLIADRPDEVEDRAEFGHWEGDLTLGTNNSAIATLPERTTRVTEIVKLAGIKSPVVVDAVVAHMQQMRTDVLVTLTWDQGKEMAEHKRLHAETKVPIYFCDPKSPWQRGTNENTNGLLRQCFPKRIADFGDYSRDDYDQVAGHARFSATAHPPKPWPPSLYREISHRRRYERLGRVDRATAPALKCRSRALLVRRLGC